MRGTRWLVLVAIAAILGGVGLTYRAQKKVLREQAPPQPAALPTELNSSAQHWHFTDTDLKTNRVIAEIDAEDFRQVKDSDRVDLKNVTIQYSQQGRRDQRRGEERRGLVLLIRPPPLLGRRSRNHAPCAQRGPAHPHPGLHQVFRRQLRQRDVPR